MPYEWDELKGPDAEELTGEDDSVDLRTCPACGQAIYEHAEQCPLCGEWVSAPRSTLGWWSAGLAVLLILAWLIMTVV